MDITHYLEIDNENDCIYNCIKYIMYCNCDGINVDTQYEIINIKPSNAKTYLLKINENEKKRYKLI